MSRTLFAEKEKFSISNASALNSQMLFKEERAAA